MWSHCQNLYRRQQSWTGPVSLWYSGKWSFLYVHRSWQPLLFSRQWDSGILSRIHWSNRPEIIFPSVPSLPVYQPGQFSGDDSKEQWRRCHEHGVPGNTADLYFHSYDSFCCGSSAYLVYLSYVPETFCKGNYDGSCKRMMFLIPESFTRGHH